jgi:hypothetical protein
MTTTTPPGLHEQLAALDEVEQALVQLTTADLERCEDLTGEGSAAPTPASPLAGEN